MIFRPYLAKLIVNGRKTQTRRMISPNPRSPWRDALITSMRPLTIEWPSYDVDTVFAVNPGRGLRRVADCRVISRGMHPLGLIGEQDAQAEGFAGRAEFLAAFREINGLDDSEPGPYVHSVAFVLVKTEPDAIERLEALLAGG